MIKQGQQSTTFQEELSSFDEMLNEFKNKQDIQMKGVLLSGLHKKYKFICSLIDKEISTIDMRRMKKSLNPKFEKLKMLEKELLLEADITFFQNLLQDFQELSKKFYSVKGTEEEMNLCFKKYFVIFNSMKDIKKIQCDGDTLKSKIEKLLKQYSIEVEKFQKKFQNEIKSYQQQVLEKDNKDQKKQNNSFSSQNSTEGNNDNEEDGEEEEISQIPFILSQNANINKNGSILDHLHLSTEKLEEEQQQLQTLKSQLQQELVEKQKQQLITEEQIQKEIQEEISLICQDISTINAMMGEISRLANDQDQHFDFLEQNTEQTLQNVISAEKDLKEASKYQVSYRKKFFSVTGAALGGGIGFLFGGIIGSALGATAGTGLGKLVGSASSKETI